MTEAPHTAQSPLAEASLAPNAAPPPSPHRAGLRTLRLADPFRWLRAGWRDFCRAPGIGLFYGGCFVAMGWALMVLFRHSPAYVLALSGGFLLMGPFLCLGLYRTSQQLERGEQPGYADSILAWERRTGQLAIFGVVLLVLEMLWARSTLVIFAITFDGMPDFKGSLLALLDPQNLTFTVVWTAVGAVFAALIFALTVVSMPMILHRETDAITAGLTSLRLVLDQPGVLAVWGALISALVLLALLPGFAGLLVVGPVVGFASWHAYRAAVADAPGTSDTSC